MYPRALNVLRCPRCTSPLTIEPGATCSPAEGEVQEGVLRCGAGHRYPVVRDIPRLFCDDAHLPTDQRTGASFSLEWEHHRPGDRTWGMDLDDRVQRYFTDAIRMPREELEGKLVLDAGCGNGSQSVAYTELGLEVIAVDLSSGLEHGQAFRTLRAGARPDRVHFVQADLQAPPLGPESVDIIHSGGVLHHTPNTERTFRILCPLLRPGGTMYVWVYKHEPVVTPVVNAIRAVTTRIPPALFARLARLGADPFRLFTWTLDRLGVRAYGRMSRREAALALMDIFGAPYAHYHSFEEVAGWFRSEGFTELWLCNESRRGFGVCGRKGGLAVSPEANHAVSSLSGS